MHIAPPEQLAFHLTGHRSDGGLEPIEGRGLVPALFAPFRDLDALRHDFPLVLSPGAPAQSLAALLDAAVAGDDTAGRLHGHARRIEGALRRVAGEGAADMLAAAWDIAVARLDGGEDGLRANLVRLRLALPREAVLAACDRALPARLVAHEWAEAQRLRTERLAASLAALAARLDDILQADFAASPEGRSPDRLRAAIGPAHAAMFDFDAMARLLARAASATGLDAERRRRIGWLIGVLRGQRFAPLPGSGVKRHGFHFASCAAALQAWRERLPAATELAKVIAMAGLEAEGAYVEARHDPLFAAFAPQPPGADFADYLVCPADLTPDEAALALQALGAGLPFKVLAQTDDLLEQAGPAALGLRVRPLVETALGLGDVFVLQSAASHLPGRLAGLRAGLARSGPALFSVYSGAGPDTAPLPPYLIAAAAEESRAFPGFVHDPDAGPDWAARFTLDGNPQPTHDWPLHQLAWEDAQHHRQGEAVAFTLADFLSCDRRVAGHFAHVTAAGWNGALVPVAEAAARSGPDPEGSVPCLFMADAEGGLHKVLADGAVLREARRCLARWRVLQERGGIHNSHAARAVAAERPERTAEPPAPVAHQAAEAPAEPVPEPARNPDAAYIETSRCSSCNECININDRMFAYDANRQAAIIDPAFGTYRQLVEAAESCQVSIIHPGRPRDPDEPGLEELLERAAPFR